MLHKFFIQVEELGDSGTVLWFVVWSRYVPCWHLPRPLEPLPLPPYPAKKHAYSHAATHARYAIHSATHPTPAHLPPPTQIAPHRPFWTIV